MRTPNITSQKLKLFYLNFFFLSRPSLPQLYFKLQCQTSTDELNVSSPAFVFCVPSYYFFHCCAHTQTCVQFYVLSIGSNFPSNHIAKGNKKREKNISMWRGGNELIYEKKFLLSSLRLRKFNCGSMMALVCVCIIKDFFFIFISIRFCVVHNV